MSDDTGPHGTLPGGTRELIALLQPRRPTRIVDIGANPLDDEPPYKALLQAGLCEVTGFEPQPEALERLRRHASAHERYLPYAIGDGRDHTLHLCAWSGFSSLFEPDPEQLDVLVDFPRMAAVTSTTTVRTVRLDGVPDLTPVDHLKLDVQGAELMIVRHAGEVLDGVTSLQVEAGFHRLYKGQPTFADLDLELRDRGFTPQSFVSVKDWPLAPVQWADPMNTSSRQLVEADVLYVRDFRSWHRLTDEQLRHLAIVCHAAHDQSGIASRVVEELIRRGVMPATASQGYRDICRSAPCS